MPTARNYQSTNANGSRDVVGNESIEKKKRSFATMGKNDLFELVLHDVGGFGRFQVGSYYALRVGTNFELVLFLRL